MSRWKGIWKDVAERVSHLAEKEVKTKAAFEIKKEEDDILTEAPRIASILMQAADDKTQVEITFGSRILIYKTRIALELDQDPKGDGGSEPSSEYLRKKSYMLLGQIDPPEGNEKLCHASLAVMQFPQGNKFNEFHSNLLEAMVGEDGKSPMYKLEFPRTIYRKPQRRDSVRFDVQEKSAVKLTVERPALVTFRALPVDISMGGMRFIQPSNVAPLTDGSRLTLTFEWPFEKKLVIPGILVKSKQALGKTRVHVRFSVDSYQITRDLGELVTHVERVELKQRSIKRDESVAAIDFVRGYRRVPEKVHLQDKVVTYVGRNKYSRKATKEK